MTEPASLPEEARETVWRILGQGASPTSGRSAWELIDDMVNKRIHGDRAGVAAVIKSWFEHVGKTHVVSTDVADKVAEIVVRGTQGKVASGPVVEALAAFEPDLIEPLLRAVWSPEQTDALCATGLDLLETWCNSPREVILQGEALYPGYGSSLRVPKDAIKGRGLLDMFSRIERHSPELLNFGIHRTVRNTLDLLIRLRPGLLPQLVRRADHAVVRVHAAEEAYLLARRSDHKATLGWITPDASEELVALGIVYTLETVNALDSEHRAVAASGSDGSGPEHWWVSELRPPEDDTDAAARALTRGLVDRLSSLESERAVSWLGDLLSEGSCLLTVSSDESDVSYIEDLEGACEVALASIMKRAREPEGLVRLLRERLKLPPRRTGLRHLGSVGWMLRSERPDVSKKCAMALLDDYAATVGADQFFVNMRDRHDFAWSIALAQAVFLDDRVDAPYEWVVGQASRLPLTQWDAEEDYSAFLGGLRGIEHAMLVGSIAFEVYAEEGKRRPAEEVMRLVNMCWLHAGFVHSERSLPGGIEADVQAAAVRVALNLGDAGDAWALERLREPWTGPRAIWLLLTRVLQDDHVRLSLAEELAARAERERDRSRLYWWGKAYSLLGVAQVEVVILGRLAVDVRTERNRAVLLLALRLALDGFAKVREGARLALTGGELGTIIQGAYRALWGAGVPDGEQAEKSEMDLKVRTLGLEASVG